jgi:hypothetical protein
MVAGNKLKTGFDWWIEWVKCKLTRFGTEPVGWLCLTALEEEDGNLTQVEVDKMSGLVCDI